jgi:predicted PurR-regulated permease PerM
VDARSSVAQVLRTVLVVVSVVLVLWLIYQLRKPIGWVLIALFLAVALTPSVNRLERHIRRGWAIAVVYLVLFLVPIGIGALVIPPMVSELSSLVDHVPQYAAEAQDYVQKNERLQKIEQDYDIVGQVRKQADKLPGRIGDAAGTLSNVGLGIVNSVFALLNILVLTAFMLSGGPRWVQQGLGLIAPERRPRVQRVLERSARAVSGYVAGALTVALIAGTSSFIVLSAIGVPFAAALAVLAGFASLIPLVGATIAAVVIGVVTLFNDFPADTIAWTVWAVLYQQIENNLIQPRIQSRTVDVQPFVILVSVLFGATLLGVLGAIVAIPIAATIQVVVREWWAWRHERVAEGPAPGQLELPVDHA